MDKEEKKKKYEKGISSTAFDTCDKDIWQILYNSEPLYNFNNV